MLHRDSLGYVQPIQPGAVNLMTAGKGIVQSERISDELLASGPDNADQRGIYVVSGQITIDDCELNSGSMAVIKIGAQVYMSAD